MYRGEQCISCKLVMTSVDEHLAEFFSQRANFDILRSVNSSCPPISLRALAWLVSAGTLPENVQAEYDKLLRLYTRRRFDPFRRSERVVLKKDDASVITTVGQMNFFKWMICSGIWKFVLANRARLAAEAAHKSLGRSKVPGPACIGMRCTPGPHVLVFD